ncbi:MAG: CehA/McbA family metallohydrolase [Nitrospirae bacterium]|nr:CehA/McbA family metallohydrolase [Nitrospirota bacterium]
MKSVRNIGMILLLLIAVVGSGYKSNPSNKQVLIPGLTELTGALIQKHPYLFNAETLSALDTLNLKLRKVTSSMEKAETVKAKKESLAQRVDIENQLLALIKKSVSFIDVDLTGAQPTMSPEGPFSFPGDKGALLFRVETGKELKRCVTIDYDMEDGPWFPEVKVDVEPDGVTWALVTITRLSPPRTTLQVDFEVQGGKTFSLPVDVITPKFGRLKVSILADDTGKPTPVMVRLVWKTDGQDRKPSNGVDLGEQLEHIKSVATPYIPLADNGDGRRPAYLPGKLLGYYWVVPGPFDMSLPPGKWEITIRKGVEHIPVFDTFTIKSKQTLEKTYRVKRWVDMPKRGWYSGDTHVHSKVLSQVNVDRLMAYVQAEDVHLANVLKMGYTRRTRFDKWGFGKKYRITDGNYILVPGQEDPRTHQTLGHVIGLNTTSMVRYPDKYFLYDLVFDAVHAEGGLAGYAHANSGAFHVYRDMSMNVPKGKIDFFEIFQGMYLGTNFYFDFLNLGYKLTATAGSDIPWGHTIGDVRVYVYLGDQPFTADAWFKSFKNGHTFVTNGPMLEFHVDDALPGDEIVVKNNRKLRIRARTWGTPERIGARPKKLEIIRLGEVIRSVESTGPGQKELSLDFDIDSGNGFWITARVIGSDGTGALSTPIYIVRPGLRFWKFKDIHPLIAKQYKRLDEIEKMVKDNQKLSAENKIPAKDVEYKLIAKLGPALLKRVNDAREIYRKLEEETAVKEKLIRNKK